MAVVCDTVTLEIVGVAGDVWYLYTLTLPLDTFGAPIATIVPSLFNDTEWPEFSPVAPPSISEPIFSQEVPLYFNTLTWPRWSVLTPLVPSLNFAPIATIVPSLLNATDHPE